MNTQPPPIAGRTRSKAPLLLAGAAALALASCAPVLKSPYSEKDAVGPRASAPDKRGDSSLGSAPSAPNAAAMGDASTSKSLGTPDGPISMTSREAMLLSLENNIAFRIERMRPEIQRTSEETARAAFDPAVSGQISRDRERTDRADGATGPATISNGTSGQVGVSETLPSGTRLDLVGTGSRSDSSASAPSGTSRTGLTVTQSLLRGFGLGVNLASLRQARLDTQISQYELRGYAESLVASVELAYWDAVLSERQIRIYEESVQIAEKQLFETRERIRVGKLASTERYAAEAEAARRREALIFVRGAYEKNRLGLLRYLNLPGTSAWDRTLNFAEAPTTSTPGLEAVERHIEVARRMRTDLNQAQLSIQRGDLELVKTKNGLLPKMDLFTTLGKSGYADSFGASVQNLTEEDSNDISGGVRMEYPLLNRAARASHRRALLNRRQAGEALANLEQLAEVDVRSAYIEVQRERESMLAAAATLKLQEETYRAENEKFRVGKSTTLQVAQAQRDLVQSQITEIQARIGAIKALIDLYRLDGSLLERRGIDAPGREPVSIVEEKTP